MFEVSIQINEKDTTLRPAMTTGNKIMISELENVLSIPLECIHNDGDSLSFVYEKEGASIIKKEIEIGQTNENEAIILNGLDGTEKVYLSTPLNFKDADTQRLPKLISKKKT